jgi:hypothetical protein
MPPAVGERLESQTADARAGDRLGGARGRHAPQQRDRVAARRPQLPLQADERFESFRHAKAIADRVAVRGQFEQRPLGSLDLTRRRIRQTADRLADRRANIGFRFDSQTRRERRRGRVDDRDGRGRLAFRSLRGLTNRGGRLGANLRQRMP